MSLKRDQIAYCLLSDTFCLKTDSAFLTKDSKSTYCLLSDTFITFGEKTVTFIMKYFEKKIFLDFNILYAIYIGTENCKKTTSDKRQ